MHELPTGTVTLLFSDIEGSTRQLQRVDERYADVLEASRYLLRTVSNEFHGHEVDTQGDAFFVAFARATDAVSAAVEAQRALASHAWPEGVAVRVRMGLHTGEPHLAAEGYVGLDVHRAARIMNAGHGGQILLSRTTRDLVEHELPEGASLRDLGAHRLKDLEHPSHLYQLVTPGLPADFPPLKTLDTYAHNLPVQLTSLIGREQEIAAVGHLLQRQEVRLLTLTGPGGTGKTRLGLQVAAELSEEFSDGVFFVNLAPLSDPELVIPTIAQTLGLKEAVGQPLLDLVSAWLREKELLLLLDNFEQVAEAAVEVSALLARCPQLCVLVTSRAALHVQGEQEFAVPPLAIPDPNHLPDLVTLSQYEAVALFIARAQAVKPEFQVTNANAPAVAEICVRLDGLPLAIELAAARSKMLPPQALLARLGQRFTLLTGGAQDVPARQQTLRNTIAWSYDLLTTEEQSLLRRLCVFVGGCTLEAAAAVCNAAGGLTTDVVDGATSLMDKSLLQQAEQEEEEPRLVLLETVREFGLESLHASEEAERCHRTHAEYYLALAEHAEPHLRGGGEQLRWLSLLNQEQENFRAALHCFAGHEETELALRLSGALWWYWFMRGYNNEALHWLETALALPNSSGRTAARANVLAAAGLMTSVVRMDIVTAQTLLKESMTLYQELKNTRGYAHAVQFLGSVHLYQGDSATARPLIEQGLALCRDMGDTWHVAFGLNDLARLTWEQEDEEAARALWEECIAHDREIGERWALPRPLLALEAMVAARGDDTQAMALLQECLTITREMGDLDMLSFSLLTLANMVIRRDDAEAARLVQEGLTIAREIGNPLDISHALYLLGEIARYPRRHRAGSRVLP